MIIIGLTGGIGTGKSTVAQLLAEKGATVIDADRVGHEVYRPDTPAWREVVAAFGQDILDEKGEVDRKKLSARAFASLESTARLNAITHPHIKRAVEERLALLRRASGVNVAVVEAALLIEAGWAGLMDEVWVVLAPPAAVVERLRKNKGAREEDILARVRVQLTPEERKRHADVVIENSGSLAELREKVDWEWERLLRRRRTTL